MMKRKGSSATNRNERTTRRTRVQKRTADTPRFCTACGGSLRNQPSGTPPVRRLTCQSCGRIAYRNPVVGVAVVITDGERVLLGRRGRGPYAGRWCIPCGYVEWDEEIRTAARREMREETGLDVTVGDVCAVHSNFHDRARQTVGVWFWGHVRSGRLRPGDDLDALDYYRTDRLPPLAFPTDAEVLASIATAAARRARSVPRGRRRSRRAGLTSRRN